MEVENNILMIQFVILSEERAKLFVSKIRGRSQEAENNIKIIQSLILSIYKLSKFKVSHWMKIGTITLM